MLTAVLAIVVAVQSVSQVASPRPHGWVTDQANMLDPATESRLNALATELETRRGIELAVVTVDSVPGSPKTFATQLFNHWGIGKAQTNNGVLVLLVMGQRRLEIETGTGVEAALTATWLADMQARDMVPRFKQRDFAGGLVAGVTAISSHLLAAPGESTSTEAPGSYRDDGVALAPELRGSSAPYAPAPVEPIALTEAAPPRDDGVGRPLAIAGGIGATGIGGGLLALRIRRRRRTCDNCQKEMLPLDELADDQHLDAGQRTEETIGSVDYEVLICPGCQASRTLRHGRWFSGFDRCIGCSYKTMRSTSTTLVHATYDHGGEVRVDESCRHCPRSHSYTRHTPRRTRPTTTSSSSSSRSAFSGSRSSGFGGGSSRGGGAGSSW